MEIKILDRRLNGELSYATPEAAAIDIRACIQESIKIYPGQVQMIGAGFAVHIDNTQLASILLPRSGMGTRGLVLANLTGLIDSDYQGEIKVAVWNRNEFGGDYFEIKPMDRIAQMMFVKIERPTFKVVEEFTNITKRGAGGFGSTGK